MKFLVKWATVAVLLAGLARADEFEVGVETEVDDLKLADPVEEEREFLREFSAQDDVIELESGVMYKVLQASESTNAKKATLDQYCKAHYKGTLRDGTEFDASKPDSPFVFLPSSMIRGWQEVLPHMTEGDRWQVVIPSSLAYGPRGVGEKIPPHSTLLFEIELLEVNPEVDPYEKLKQFAQQQIPGIPFKLQIWQAVMLVFYIAVRVYLKQKFGVGRPTPTPQQQRAPMRNEKANAVRKPQANKKKD